MLTLVATHWGASAADEDLAIQTELIAEVRETVHVGPDRDAVRFVPATVLSQGQVVFYTVRIVNRSPVYAQNVVVVQRIPANTAYVPGSAAGPAAKVSFSRDGGQTYESESLESMGDRERPPAVSEYTHIRWELAHALAPGAVALARFQATFQ